MQIRSRDPTAPQEKMGTLLARVISLNWYQKIQNKSRYKTAVGTFEIFILKINGFSD